MKLNSEIVVFTNGISKDDMIDQVRLLEKLIVKDSGRGVDLSEAERETLEGTLNLLCFIADEIDMDLIDETESNEG